MTSSTAHNLRAAGASIDASGWGWRHAGRRAWAVKDLGLRIDPGERVLLLGASGAGKSTLVHALAGVLGAADEGEEQGTLLVNGTRPADARGQVGLLMQDPDSQVILARVGDDVAFGCENLGVPRDETWLRVRESLAMVGLDLPLHHPTSALSGGQKQRLAVAGVLAHTQATFVVIEHRVGVWQHLVNRVIVLDPAGGVLADGNPDDVLSAEGTRLSASGVWVPGTPLELPARRRSPRAPDRLLGTDGLAIARSREFVVARDIEVEVSQGTALAITGPNGAGKSTLALTLA